MASSSKKEPKNQLFIGTFIHSKKLDELKYLHNTAVCVDKSGKIVTVEPQCDLKKAEETVYPKLGWSAADVDVTIAKDGQFFFPGFIDTHIHAPQYPNAGIFGKSTLLDWLSRYTFPMEASLSDLGRARRVYARCVRRTLAHGTTTAVYFATIHVAATNLLADLCLALGQRALVGRVCMDRLGPPAYLDESPAAALAATRACVAHARAIDPPGSALITPVVTPRFAPACSAETLRGLGDLVREHQQQQQATAAAAAVAAAAGGSLPGGGGGGGGGAGGEEDLLLPVQTHVSENAGEVGLVRALFPESAHYADVYDRAGLLGRRTILAHAVHLSEAEADLIAARGAKVAHCPCSNSALTSGEARVRWLLDKGIGVGLGTDVSGGYSPSVLEAARLATLVSNHLAMPGRSGGGGGAASQEERERAKLSVEEVLYLATRGGAEVVGLPHRIGAFEVGMDWDAQLVALSTVGEADGDDDDDDNDVHGDYGNVDIFGWETWDERIAKWLYNGDDRNTRMVWVKGRLVHARK